MRNKELKTQPLTLKTRTIMSNLKLTLRVHTNEFLTERKRKNAWVFDFIVELCSFSDVVTEVHT